MELLQVICLALIQGITEFLPISSSGHLILASKLTDWPDQGLAFDIAVHLGSLIAVFAYFRDQLTQFASSSWRYLTTRQTDDHLDLMLKIGAATLPVVVVGLLFRDVVATELRTVPVIATTTIVFGLVLWWADKHRGDTATLSWRSAVFIGLAQALAIIPGTSRSGIAISAALLLGLSRTMAAQTAFLLAIPTIGGAALLAYLDLPAVLEPTQAAHLALGVAVSAMSAYLCIRFFIALVERTGMLPYVFYRLALGAFLWTLLWMGPGLPTA